MSGAMTVAVRTRTAASLRLLLMRPMRWKVTVSDPSNVRAMSAAKPARPSAVKLSYSVYESTKPGKQFGATPVVILHGLFGSKSNWHSLSKAILNRTGRKVISVDARNHGESAHRNEMNYDVMKEDVLALLDELNVSRAILVGHSMGGRTSMMAALTEPSYIEKLVVVDISPLHVSPNSTTFPLFLGAMLNHKMPRGVPLSEARKFANDSLKHIVESEGQRQFLLTNMIEDENKNVKWRLNLDSLAVNIPYLMEFAPRFDNKYEGPTLFIGGGNSDYIRMSDHDVIKQRFFPNADFVYIAGAGHWVHAEKPVEFLDIFCQFSENDPES